MCEYVCVSVCVCECVCASVCVCMCVCVSVWVCILYVCVLKNREVVQVS